MFGYPGILGYLYYKITRGRCPPDAWNLSRGRCNPDPSLGGVPPADPLDNYK